MQYTAGHKYVAQAERSLLNNLDKLQDGTNKYHPLG